MLKRAFLILLPLLVITVFLTSTYVLAGDRPGEGWYTSFFANASILNAKGHFTTGAPIPAVETVRYNETITSYGVGGALGYGAYVWPALDIYLGAEINGAYTPFDEKPSSSNPNFSLKFERNYTLGAKGLVGISIVDSSLLYGHAGMYYANQSYGTTFITGDGWEDHDLFGPGFGVGYRNVLTRSLDLFIEYTHIRYNQDQSLKDGAASKQRIRDNDVRVGISYRFDLW